MRSLGSSSNTTWILGGGLVSCWRHGYPPDKQEKATQTVLEQAEVLSGGWAQR